MIKIFNNTSILMIKLKIKKMQKNRILKNKNHVLHEIKVKFKPRYRLYKISLIIK